MLTIVFAWNFVVNGTTSLPPLVAPSKPWGRPAVGNDWANNSRPFYLFLRGEWQPNHELLGCHDLAWDN